jgi:putative molybdopterin biosynthesis protein
MNQINTMNTPSQLKILGDTHRREILRRLMAEPATLSELGLMLKRTPAWVRHHLKVLEAAGLVEPTQLAIKGRTAKKQYRAMTHSLLLQELILPYSQKNVINFFGSLDPAIRLVADGLGTKVTLLTQPMGSLDSLINLRQGLCHIAGTHLRDTNGEYNIPFVRNLFMDRTVSLFTLAHRTQGLLVAAGNPRNIKSVDDLAREDVRLVNREPGSGTRVWLNQELGKRGIPINVINGFESVVYGHSAAANLVAMGNADVSAGIQAAAQDAGIGFIPILEERYDLVIPCENLELAAPLLDYIQSSDFRSALGSLAGYNSSHSGEQVIFE